MATGIYPKTRGDATAVAMRRKPGRHPGVRGFNVPPAPSCFGSLLPARHLQAGDEVVCEFCRAKLPVVPPPGDRNRDPWLGSPDARVEAHESV
jgi:hypothetical protein